MKSLSEFKSIRWLCCHVVFFGSLAHADDVNTLPQLGRDPLAAVIAELTLAEKVKMVRGMGMSVTNSGPTVGVSFTSSVPGSAGDTYPVPRLGIPSIVLADGPAGVRIAPRREGVDDQTFYCTAFPVATLLASSWDIDLINRVGQAMGNELKEYGADILLAPALNIQRYPLGGRNYEYYSEDPLLSGKIASAMVNGIQSHDVGTSIKHFVANNHEWNRNSINVIIDERALREIYLKGFEIAVKESRPWTVMSSYNKLNGTYTSESERLLTDILRTQWKFDGLVVSDWFGGTDAVAQMLAGNDLLMPGTPKQEQQILDAVNNGALAEEILDRNVANVLRLVVKTPTFKGYQYNNKPDLIANARIARIAASEGMVLLKNVQGVLPLNAPKNLAVFGNNSYQMVIGGTGSGDVNEAYSVSMGQGLKGVGFTIDEGLSSAYKAYLKAENALRPERSGIDAFLPVEPIVELSFSETELLQLAQANDAALITIGRSSGEFADRKEQADFYLSEIEQAMLGKVSGAFHELEKPVVAILNIGGVIETVSWRDKVDAIVLAWQPGQEAGNAIADVLVGNINPSGKLATTFAISLDDYVARKNFPGVVTDPEYQPKWIMDPPPSQIEYEDGIWVGYRDFNSNKKDLAYPFGFGLSYTEFKYSDLKLDKKYFIDSIIATVNIKNSGKVPGKEVVQLYVSAPASDLPKPTEELRAFAKTRLLQPGESQTISFSLKAEDLASFDSTSGQWLVDGGTYQVKSGASSRDFRQFAHFKKKKTTYLTP